MATDEEKRRKEYIDDMTKKLGNISSEEQYTCPKCNNVFTPPLNRILPFTEEQYKRVIQQYGQNFQICPKCNNIFNPNAASGGGGACFVATAVFDNYDSPEVVKLRLFRDNFLRRHLLGRAFIAFYYKTGPYLASAVKHNPAIKNLLRRLFKTIL